MKLCIIQKGGNRVKNKRGLLFIIIFIGLTAILASRYFKITEDIYEKRNKEDNPAEKIIMTGGKEYVAGHGDFHTGFYDIQVDKPTDTNAFKLGKNQSELNKSIRNENRIYVEEGDTVTLTPSRFEPMIFKNNIAVLENTIGEFQCGTEIEPGTYEFTIEVANKNMEFFFQVTNEKTNNNSSEQINYQQSARLTIEKDDYLSISGLDIDTGNFKIIIRKLTE